jgi:dTDP-4-amino-4,6-dideoxygalactose transaminase
VKKKNIEKQSAIRLKKIESLEAMLGRRREEMQTLKSEIAGCREVMHMLEAIVYQLVREEGYVEIDRDKLAEGIRKKFKIEIKDKLFILKAE